jgi:YtkA-like protein
MRHLVSLLALAACGGGSSGPSVDAFENIDCSTITGTDQFAVGLQKPGEANALTFTMVSGDPAPPARGDNTWVVQIDTQAAAAPVTNATIDVTPFMPAHQHGAGKAVQVMPMPTAGQYQLAPVNLWMPGVWETTINVTAPTADHVVFRFCIPS